MVLAVVILQYGIMRWCIID